MKSRKTAVAGIILILIHLGISFAHGRAHRGAMVDLTRFQFWYVVIVIMIAPLVAGVLLLTRWQRFGAVLLAVSMLGSFGFGTWYHFIADSSDNVFQVHGPWHFTFGWTAVALSVSELIGFVTGLLIYRRGQASPQTNPLP